MLLRSSRRVASVIAAVMVVATSAAFASAATADDPDGIGLTVTVTSTPTPSPTASPSGGNNNNSGSGTVVTPVDQPSPAETRRPGEANLGGILYVSGLSLDGKHSINPAATEAKLQFTVHNVSDTVINAKATFHVDNALGLQLGETRTVAVTRLKPDEIRVVQTTITDLGQWGVLHGTVVFTPPKKVEGVSLAPLTREQFFFVLPWFVGILTVLGAAALAIFWIVRYTTQAGSGFISRSGQK